MKRFNYMRLILLCTLLVANRVQAQDEKPGALLRCLAQEEAQLHQQKRSGPQYKLNQLFFNEWSGNPSLELRPEVFARVCGNHASSASINLLREFMLGGKNLFRSVKLRAEDPMTTMRRITLEELRRQMPQVLFTYVADLEVYAPTADCLERAIPTLATLRRNYRYLESEISLEFMDSHKEEWRTIFNELKKWPQFFKQCQKRLEQSEKNTNLKGNIAN